MTLSVDPSAAMPVPPATLDELIWLSHELGRHDRDLIMLAEGNTSALLDDGSFLVKASGARLEQIGGDEFTRLRLEPLLEVVRGATPCDVPTLLAEARSEPSPSPGVPSIETFVHAVCLEMGGARFVAHTHPTQLVGLLSTPDAKKIMTAGPLFPDEAVVCGVAPLYVQYAEPGLELGRTLAIRMREHIAIHGEPPRAILLANHGLVTMGRSASDALAVTLMAVKAARVRAAALAAGGLRPLTAASLYELARRPDEIDRRVRFTGAAGEQ
jgi:rhamnose utilization protein RhaD (predicted bifunctional aldolase and dehydrogenase)